MSYDNELNITNFNELMKIKESDILNDEIQRISTNTQNEEYIRFQKQKIEYALASVLNDMKQLDTNTLSNKSTSKNSSIIFSTNENTNGFTTKNRIKSTTEDNKPKVTIHNSEDDDDYVEPPDDDEEFKNDDDIILSSSTSTSTSTIPNAKLLEDKISELIIKTAVGSSVSNTMSPLQNTFKGNKEILNKSIEEIRNLIQTEITPKRQVNNNNNNSYLVSKSIQKIHESTTPTTFSHLKSPSLSLNRLASINNKTDEKSPIPTTTTPPIDGLSSTLPNKSLNLNVICGNVKSSSMIASPIMRNNNTLTKNSSILNNNHNNKLTNSTSTPIRNSNSSSSNNNENNNEQQQQLNFDSKTIRSFLLSEEQHDKNDQQQQKQKSAPPPIMKKPENADEILRKLSGGGCLASPDGNLTIRLSKSRATDV